MKAKRKDTEPPVLPKSLKKKLNDPKTVQNAHNRMMADRQRAVATMRVEGEKPLNPVYPEFVLPAGKAVKSGINLMKGAPSLKSKIAAAIYPTIRVAENASDVYEYANPSLQGGGMIKRKDGSYSKRGLWDNIRKNIGSGKKPTKAMLKAEKKIKNEG